MDDKKKNIIIIIIDALRPKNISLYGHDKGIDKNLKRIAEDSIFFKQHFSVSNCTLPSFTSLFSGKYPENLVVHFQTPYMDKEEFERLEKNKFWLPSYLKERGYHTIAIDWLGLWLKDGFDYYKEAEADDKLKTIRNLSIINKIKPLVRWIRENIPSWLYRIKIKIKEDKGLLFPSAEQITDTAILQIKQTKKPFFLFMHYWDTHFPFPTMKSESSGENEVEEILKRIKDDAQKEYFKKRITDVGLYSLGDIRDKYEKAIKKVDKQLKKFYKFLKKEKLLKDSLLIILADHGWRLDEHGMYLGFCGCYDEMYHVPLIMKLPGVEGREIDKLVQNVDIAPTILDYLGDKGKIGGLDGRSMVPLIKEDKEIRNKVFLFDSAAKNSKAVRTKKRKLILTEDKKCLSCKSKHHEEIEEYDLEKDPGETKNIFSGDSELMKFFEEIQKDL